MAKDPMKSIIMYASGVWMEPLNARPEDIHIEDIAHSLSLQCRWNGHIKEYYSVAQHCVAVMDDVVQEKSMFWALMHDATECYLCDVPRPLKPLLNGYHEAEERLAQVIRAKYNIPFDKEVDDDVKLSDYRMLIAEGRYLGCDIKPNEMLDVKLTNQSWSPKRAKKEFLKAFDLFFE